ncbi:unnamed protein product [Ectocarpus sp. 4 AP-2014]
MEIRATLRGLEAPDYRALNNREVCNRMDSKRRKRSRGRNSVVYISIFDCPTQLLGKKIDRAHALLLEANMIDFGLDKAYEKPRIRGDKSRSQAARAQYRRVEKR